MRILVTGGGGFVAPFVCGALLRAGHEVRATIRRPEHRVRVPPGCEPVVVPDLAEPRASAMSLAGTQAIVHLAAKVHDVTYRSTSDFDGYAAANADVTAELARRAAASGVRVFVFVSSIKVNGEASVPGQPFTAASCAMPADAYAVSKWRAELALREVAAVTGLRSVVVRPPLVYGPGVGGNFLRLMHLVARRFPLPLASVRNLRSVVYVENLADLLLRCLDAPDGTLVLASDSPALSTPALVGCMASALGVPARLWPCPPWVLRACARVVRRSAEIERLIGSLEIDPNEPRRILGWRAPVTVHDGMLRTAEWFRRASSEGARH